MAENNIPEEKPFWQKNKVLYTLMVTVLVVGALLTLALTGRIEVTSEQILSFGEWVLTLLVGGHVAQRGAGYIAQAIGAAKSAGLIKDEE